MSGRRTLWLALAIAISGTAVHAHHSLSAYDSSRQVSIQGVVTQFHFVNPHPMLVVEVNDTNGKVQEWRLELDNRWELSAVGITAETFKPGDRLVVSGNRGRAQSPPSMYVQKLDRPADGFGFEQVNSSPRLRR